MADVDEVAGGARLFYSDEQLAARWGVSTTTVKREAQAGRLRKQYIRGLVRFSAEAVAEYEAANRDESVFTKSARERVTRARAEAEAHRG